MANNYKNSISLGVKLQKVSEIQSELKSTIEQLQKNNDIKIKIDTSQVNQSLKEFGNTLNNISTQLKSGLNLQGAFNGQASGIENVINKLKEQQSEIEKTANTMKILSTNKVSAINDDGSIKEDLKDITKLQDGIGKTITLTNNLKTGLTTATKSENFSKLDNVISNLQNKLNTSSKNSFIDASVITELQNKLNSLNTNTAESEVKELQQTINNLSSSDNQIIRLQNAISRMGTDLTAMRGKYEGLVGDSSSKKQLNDYLAQVEKLKTMLKSLQNGDTFSGDKLKNELDKGVTANRELTNSVKNSGNAFKLAQNDASSFSTTLKKAFENAGIYLSVYQAIFMVKTAIESGVKTIIDMDKALGNLNKVANMTNAQLLQMRDSAVSMGKELGRSSIEIANAQAEFGRLYKTQEEINNMTKVSVMGANVMDGVSSAEVAKGLTTVVSSMKMEAKDSMTILDSMNEIQNNYRVGASDLLNALAEVGSTAYTSGANLQQVEGYITSIAVATGKTGDEIGNSLKSIMSRVYKLGAEGLEAEGKPEKMLNDMGVAVRDAEGNFRSFSTILGDLDVKWKNMSNTEKIATAQVVGGVHRYNDFISLMNNYKMSVDSTSTALNSQGSALKENEIHMSTASAKLGTLKATTEELAYKMINSDAVKETIDDLTAFVSGLQNIDGKTIKYIATLGLLATAMYKISALNKTLIAGETVSGLAKFISIASGMSALESGVTGVSGAFTLLGTGIKTATTSAIAFMLTPLGLTLGALAITTGIVVGQFAQYENHQAELKQTSTELKSALDGVNESLKQGNTTDASKNLEKVRDEQTKLIDLIKQRKELEESGASKSGSNSYYNNLGKVTKVNADIKDSIAIFEELGMSVDKTSGKVTELSNIESQINNTDIVNKIKEQTKAQIENRENLEGAEAEYQNFISTTQDLYAEYQTLSEQENLSVEQKTRLGEVCDGLQSKFTDLNVSVDENGVAHIENSQLISDNISYLTSEGMTVQTLTMTRTADSKACSEWSIGNQQMTYQEVMNNIENYKIEIDALAKLMEARKQGSSGAIGTAVDSALDVTKSAMDARLNQMEGAKSKIDSIYGSIKAPVNNASNVGGGNYSPSGDGGSKKSGKSDAEKAQEEAEKWAEKIADLNSSLETDQYYEANNAISQLNNAMTSLKTSQENLTGSELAQSKEKENEIIEKQILAYQRLQSQQELERDHIADTLSSYGIVRDEVGQLTNAQEKLAEMQARVNSMSGDTEVEFEAKKQAVEQVKSLNEEIKRYGELVDNVIPNSVNKWQELAESIKKANMEALSNLRTELAEDILKEAQDKVDKLKEQLANKKKDEIADIEKEKQATIDSYDAEIESVQKQLDALNDTSADNEKKLKALKAEKKLWEKDDSVNKYTPYVQKCA